eukprot:1136688-Pelagomonas_calceolata.AAC.4
MLAGNPHSTQHSHTGSLVFSSSSAQASKQMPPPQPCRDVPFSGCAGRQSMSAMGSGCTQPRSVG